MNNHLYDVYHDEKVGSWTVRVGKFGIGIYKPLKGVHADILKGVSADTGVGLDIISAVLRSYWKHTWMRLKSGWRVPLRDFGILTPYIKTDRWKTGRNAPIMVRTVPIDRYYYEMKKGIWDELEKEKKAQYVSKNLENMVRDLRRNKVY